ncbi:hypothetical protein Leryth_017752 [Lithospermum erythrorhizon]|nr:hypothetical protein Leryth_017752 [Lithospermum erythrorhizon]
MEAGSSGSFQSSSGGVGVGGGGGGDEEHDSRGESMSSFMSTQQQLFLSHHQQTPSFFQPSNDHHSQNLDASFFMQNANYQRQYDNNEQIAWSRGFNCGNFGNFSSTASASSSLPSSTLQPLGGTQRGGRMINESPFSASLLNFGRGRGGEEAMNNPSTMAAQPPPPPPNVGAPKGTNPKKRTRASRRAPTTVLTTDTTNFRQMVQEFTGIPAPPFSCNNPGGSTLARRLDLFSSAGASSIRGGHQLDNLSSLYPLRPSAKKLTPPSSLLGTPSSSSPILSSSLIMNNAIDNTIINNAALGLPQHFKQPHLHGSIHSMQNQLLNFQPLVQSSLSPSIFNSATRPHYQGSSSMNIPPSLDVLGSFLNQQRSSEEVETQSSLREDDQGGRHLNNKGQDGQNDQFEGTSDGNFD